MELNTSHNSLSEGLLATPRVVVEDAHFDITAMVDLVFMMNIFFLVTWVGAAMAEVDLPAARHGIATDVETSIVVTMVAGDDNRAGTVYLGEVGVGTPLQDMEEIERQVRDAAEAGAAAGQDVVLIKGEKQVRLRDIARIGGAVGAVEGMRLRLAVMEKE